MNNQKMTSRKIGETLYELFRNKIGDKYIFKVFKNSIELCEIFPHNPHDSMESWHLFHNVTERENFKETKN